MLRLTDYLSGDRRLDLSWWQRLSGVVAPMVLGYPDKESLPGPFFLSYFKLSFSTTCVFSTVSNLLLLIPSIFLLQVFDRVLTGLKHRGAMHTRSVLYRSARRDFTLDVVQAPLFCTMVESTNA